MLKRKLKVLDEYKMVKDLPKEGQKKPQQNTLVQQYDGNKWQRKEKFIY